MVFKKRKFCPVEVYDGASDKYAYRNGFFVIKATGDGLMEIVNNNDFKPEAY